MKPARRSRGCQNMGLGLPHEQTPPIAARLALRPRRGPGRHGVEAPPRSRAIPRRQKTRLAQSHPVAKNECVMEVREAIRVRRAVRDYVDEPLSEETVKALIDMAALAPS